MEQWEKGWTIQRRNVTNNLLNRQKGENKKKEKEI